MHLQSRRPPLRLVPAVLILFLVTPIVGQAQPEGAPAPRTEIQWLSGRDVESAVPWEFRCREGRGCGSWTTIPVPSNWELQGFGTYDYGNDENDGKDVGDYRLTVEIDPRWRDRRVELVFDGAMTDTEVRWNGQSLGPAHQGGFYRFGFDVTDRLRFDSENLLEVTVHEHSADRSINLAERDADYWVFGGIYRPVWLQAHPLESIDHLKVKANHRGEMTVQVRLREPRPSSQVRLTVFNDADQVVATLPATALSNQELSAGLAQRSWTVDNPLTWSAEEPNLHRLEAELIRDGQVLHVESISFGFRTVEWRPGAGLFVNDQRVRLRGVNRHTFWPSYGRATFHRADRHDAERLKAMHVNAVRTSHYPPDTSFLDACDELGIYVIDELAGWKDAYSTTVGRPLIRSMVERDGHRPSIIAWANGNEGGWNAELDDEFSRHDLQDRQVLRPDSLFRGIDSHHYPTWDELQDRLDEGSLLNRWRDWRGDLPLIMPTELLHGLYDGGSAASMEDYWQALRRSPRGVGAFLWVMADEAVERTDRRTSAPDFLDANGNQAPDGIFGPYREPSAHVVALQQLWSPVRLAFRSSSPSSLPHSSSQTHILDVTNDFDHLALDEVILEFEWLDGSGASVGQTQRPAPPLKPGGTTSIESPVQPAGAEAVQVTALSNVGAQLGSAFTPLMSARRSILQLEQDNRSQLGSSHPIRVETEQGITRWVAESGTGFALSEEGSLVAWIRRGAEVPATTPRLNAGKSPRLLSSREVQQGDARGRELQYSGSALDGLPWNSRGALQSLRWMLYPSGWIRLSYRFTHRHRDQSPAIIFPMDAAKARRWLWTGLGPHRQWNNRRAGRWGAFSKDFEQQTAAKWGHEPKVKGYYRARRGLLETAAGNFGFAVESDSLHLGVFTPDFPSDSEEAVAVSPEYDGIGVFHFIPAIGTKFHPPADLGPSAAEKAPTGLYEGALWIHPDPPNTPEAPTSDRRDGDDLNAGAPP